MPPSLPGETCRAGAASQRRDHGERCRRRQQYAGCGEARPGRAFPESQPGPHPIGLPLGFAAVCAGGVRFKSSRKRPNPPIRQGRPRPRGLSPRLSATGSLAWRTPDLEAALSPTAPGDRTRRESSGPVEPTAKPGKDDHDQTRPRTRTSARVPAPPLHHARNDPARLPEHAQAPESRTSASPSSTATASAICTAADLESVTRPTRATANAPSDPPPRSSIHTSAPRRAACSTVGVTEAREATARLAKMRVTRLDCPVVSTPQPSASAIALRGRASGSCARMAAEGAGAA